MNSPPHQQFQQVALSNEAWECISTINDAMTSAHCTLFLSDQMKRTQHHIKDSIPDLGEGMWFRVKYEEGSTFAFSFSDSAIQHYQPLLRSSICFGVAVKVLGAYEAYVNKIVSHTENTRKPDLDAFKKKHKNRDVFKIGRGLDFFEKILGCKMLTDAWKPILNFFFELRNVAVHNLSRADRRLCTAAQSEYIINGSQINEGDLVEWSINYLNKLCSLMHDLIPSIDKSASLALGLSQMEKVPPWHYEEQRSVSGLNIDK